MDGKEFDDDDKKIVYATLLRFDRARRAYAPCRVTNRHRKYNELHANLKRFYGGDKLLRPRASRRRV